MAEISFNKVLEKVNKTERPVSVKSVAESFGIHIPFSLRGLVESLFSPLAPVDFHGHFGEITSSSVSVPITFSWRDPGQGTLKQAEWFRLFKFVDPHKPPISILSSSEPHLSTDLAFHTNYRIRLRAVNIDIESGDMEEDILVETPDRPPPP